MKVAALFAALASFAVFLDPGSQLDAFERKTLDARYRFFARPGPHTGDIVILHISEEAIQALAPFYGRWPWPRAVHADAIDYLEADGARAIGFDILFPERALRQEVDAATIGELKALAKNADLADVRAELQRRLDAVDPALSDAWFVERVGKSSNVFQASVFHVAEGDLALDPGLAADAETAARIGAALAGSAVPAKMQHAEAVFFNATIPFEALARAARGVGHINYLPDSDGVCRRFLPLAWLAAGDAAYPSLGLIVAAAVKGIPPERIGVERDRVIVGDVEIPLLPDGSTLIDYRGGRVTHDSGGKARFESFYRHISYDAVLASADFVRAGKEPPLPRGTFANKIVLVTASAAGLSDLRATPFSPVTPGVEIHANVIDNVLSGGFLRRPDDLAEKGYIFALALAVAAIAARTRPRVGAMAVALLAAALIGLHWVLFGYGWVLPIVSVSVALAATYLGVVLFKYAAEEKEKTRIRAAFGHYLAPQVLEEVLRSPERLRLGGERRRITVLFSDIEGFSSLSERLTAEDVGAMLNEYLDRMLGCIKRTGGTLDKFIGDAVMAEWNAPIAQPDHAARACEAALLMMDEAARLAAKWRAEGKPPLAARIGINTGEMIVGNLGSREIFDYTVIGDEVNIAARLEPLNKDFASRIAVSGSTRAEAETERAGAFVFRRLARVTLKGKTAPLDVHELVGSRDAVPPQRMEAIARYEQGLDRFLERRFAEARQLFERTLEGDPDDGPASRYLGRCAAYEKTPPPPDWQGVYAQESK
ncbi:MAG: adenylate/guanylate cyclase domain-containing protein [Burkholderiales bacterium]|nr:adenylate/guanylate cyclase domain-containing protein [Burkholderiales bacterium]